MTIASPWMQGARGVVADRIASLLKPTLHLQSFRELNHPRFSPKVTVVKPKSVTVNNMINAYGQKLRNTADVLNKLNHPLTYAFVNNQVSAASSKLPFAPFSLPSALGCRYTN